MVALSLNNCRGLFLSHCVRSRQSPASFSYGVWLQAPFRGHLLELLSSTGVNVMRQMNPMTVTHVVTTDVNENTEKVNRARQHM